MLDLLRLLKGAFFLAVFRVRHRHPPDKGITRREDELVRFVAMYSAELRIRLHRRRYAKFGRRPLIETKRA